MAARGNPGTTSATVAFERMEGGFVLVQQVDLDHARQKIKGVEHIGYDELEQALASHYFDNTGNVFEYVWVIGDDTLTIWGGYVGSPASFKGTLNRFQNSFGLRE